MQVHEDIDDELPKWEEALANGSFEEVFAALESSVACLESGRLSLDRSLRCFELGARLAERCDRMLAEAELRVSRLDGVLERIEGSSNRFDFDDLDDVEQ